MLLLKNLNLVKNIALSQQTKCVALLNTKRELHATCLLQAQQIKADNHASPAEKIRVYYGTLTPQIRAVKLFSLTTSAVGVCAQPVLYEQAAKLGSSTPVIVCICGFIGFFTFITPILIHMITKKYVTELHYDQKSKEYIATAMTFFMTKKQIRFKPEDVEVPDVPGMFTSFLVKQKNSKIALFVDPRLFEDTMHYIKIMGYDKPIDFQLNLNEKDSAENQANK